MTLLELINELQKLRSETNDNKEVQVCVWETNEDYGFDQIKSVEETENENLQKIIGISLEHAFQDIDAYW